MFISHKKGLTLDGTNPTLLYGYGGFNISLTPAFSVSSLVWMEMGGVYAVANLRGGGEYGEDWHQAGTKLKKQNVFDDFIAAAEWLIAQKYTSTAEAGDRRAARNGGLLVGAVHDAAARALRRGLPAVGVMDMLRFHKFTIGWAWVDDYGSSDDPEQFKALYAYSPLHNIKPGTCYPPTLITTADHDDRVVPAPQLQVRRRAAGGAGVRQPGLDPHRDQGRPRRGQADGQDHRGGRRPLGLPRQDPRRRPAGRIGAREMTTKTRICVVVFLSAAALSACPQARADGRWTAEKANAWYKARPWPVGCNYNPSTAINQLEMWQADTFDPGAIGRELKWAEDLGFNSVRVFLHNIPWEKDREGFLRRMETFLELADEHGISVMFVLLDSVWDPFPKAGPQPAPKPHLHNSGWVQAPGLEILKDPARHGEMEGYVRGVISRFWNDRRVIAWDLFNEPDNTNGSSYKNARADG